MTAKGMDNSGAGSAAGETVVLEFESFREFLNEHSSQVSPDGMFVPHAAPRGEGEKIEFEIRLGGDFRLMRGAGVVEWAVAPKADDEPGHEPGMAIRFAGLDEPGRRLVARLIDNYRSTGGEPFQLDRRPAEADMDAPLVFPPRAAAHAAGAASGAAEFEETVLTEIPGAPAGGDAAPILLDADAAVDSMSPNESLPVMPLFAADDQDEQTDAADEPGDEPFDASHETRDVGIPALDDELFADPPADAYAPEYDYVEKEGASGRGRMVTWLLVCLLAVALGVVSLLYRDTLAAYLPWFGDSVVAGDEAGEDAIAGGDSVQKAVGTQGEAADGHEAGGTSDAATDEELPAEPIVEPQTEPTAEVAPAPAAESSASPATATGDLVVRDVAWNLDGSSTIVTINLSETISREDFAVMRVTAGAPRELVKIFGVSEPYGRQAIEVGTAQVARLRFGFHPKGSGGDVHLVADLAGPGVRVKGVEHRDATLTISLSGD